MLQTWKTILSATHCMQEFQRADTWCNFKSILCTCNVALCIRAFYFNIGKLINQNLKRNDIVSDLFQINI